jgi:hypothetical protein
MKRFHRELLIALPTLEQNGAGDGIKLDLYHFFPPGQDDRPSAHAAGRAENDGILSPDNLAGQRIDDLEHGVRRKRFCRQPFYPVGPVIQIYYDAPDFPIHPNERSGNDGRAITVFTGKGGAISGTQSVVLAQITGSSAAVIINWGP